MLTIHFLIGLTRDIAALAGRSHCAGGAYNNGGADTADSENENGPEITPDTDTDSQEPLQKYPAPSQSSFKRAAPVMGHRGLETRNSKRAQHPPPPPPPLNKNNGIPISCQLPSPNLPPPTPNMHPAAISAITVGALEVHNVKRAINRYGTLPKGARIGAYLESLRQTGGETNADAASAQQPVHTPAAPSSLASTRNVVNTTPGVKNQQPQMIRSNSSGGVTMTNSATASLNKLQRHRTTTDGTMNTFSSFRGASSGSPKRSANPALADLEFPPPPIDLPPPAEEFETATTDIELPPPRPMDTTPSPSVMLMSMSMAVASSQPSNDVSNTEPSVKEASSRFGVSLRKREPSTDSCSSLGSPGDPTADSVKDKLEAKLVSEIKHESSSSRTVKKLLNNDVPKDRAVDPAQQLVSELAETMNLPGHDLPLVKKLSGGIAALPPKPALATDAGFNGVPASVPSTNSFKAQLKKVDPKKIMTTQVKEENTNIIDFKARLRKVENNNEPNDEGKVNGSGIAEDDETGRRRNGCDISSLGRSNSSKVIELKKTEIKVEVSVEKVVAPVATATTAEEEEKRKSTGSISSLKKLWEAKEGSTITEPQQLSPKLTARSAPANNNKSDEDNDEPSSQIDPTHKKPVVPVKPTKLVSIYATPIQVKLPPNCDLSQPIANTTPIDRIAILELVARLESSLKNPINSIGGSQWLQLSDKLNCLQSSCVEFAERETMAPHSKFQFREVVTRLELQAQSLRSAGSKNVQENERLVMEVGQSLKQISNALHR